MHTLFLLLPHYSRLLLFCALVLCPGLLWRGEFLSMNSLSARAERLCSTQRDRRGEGKSYYSVFLFLFPSQRLVADFFPMGGTGSGDSIITCAAASFWFFSRALSRWLPRVMMVLFMKCKSTKRGKEGVLYVIWSWGEECLRLWDWEVTVGCGMKFIFGSFAEVY